MDNEIGTLGCEFLGSMLGPEMEVPLLKLKLDHNDIGTEGLERLARGLARNKVLEKLSMCYCNIDSTGVK